METNINQNSITNENIFFGYESNSISSFSIGNIIFSLENNLFQLILWASQVTLVVKNPPANAGNRCRFGPWVGKIPWRRAWQPTPVFLFGESDGQMSLVGYSP